MKTFRVAREASTARHVTHTWAQLVLFWWLFLWLLPELVQQLEHSLGVAPMRLAWPRALGGTLFVGASSFAITAAMFMAITGRGTPLPLQTAREFVAVGPYRWLRNPMALCGIAQGCAVGLWRDSGAVIVYALAGAPLWHWLVRPAEERDLQMRFGNAFASYRSQVGLWLPLWSSNIERAAGGLLVLIGPWLALAMPCSRAVPTTAASLLLGVYLLCRDSANASSSGHSSTKSRSSSS